MKLPRSAGAILLLLISPLVRGQMIDRCSPGWSMLNQLREQLTPDTPKETLQLLQVSITKRLENCRGIPDLWYYRAIVSERLQDVRDAAYARKQAAELGSPALLGKADPFHGNQQPAVKLSAAIHEKYALVVGINEFQNARGLRYAVADAESMAQLLADPQVGRFRKSNVTSLLNQNATLQNFKTAIGEIRAQAKEDDLIVVYIASHGSPRADDPNGVSYILMSDTKLDSAASLYATSLQMIDLVDILRRDVRARRVVLILDTCYSGDATASRGFRVYTQNKSVGAATDFSVATDKFEDKTTDGAARIVLSATRADEQSMEDAEKQHGYFTSYLLEALADRHGEIPLKDVFQIVHDRTAKAVGERYPGRTQTPTLRSTSAGLDIVLGVPPAGQ